MTKTKPMTAAEVAAAEYADRTNHIRKTLAPDTAEFADAMSRACEEYEVAMRSAAQAGDRGAKKALRNSKGKYLR
jgi:hypothetical protein